MKEGRPAVIGVTITAATIIIISPWQTGIDCELAI